MPEFIPNEPIETAEPRIEVTIEPERPLPIGVHRFQLVVIDSAENPSQPSLVEVIIQDTQNPTAVLDVLDIQGNRTNEIEYGQSFILSGERSTDRPPGEIVQYRWTLVSDPDRPS